MAYLDLAIRFGVLDLPPNDARETPEILVARQLRAECLLFEDRYAEAQTEAERVIEKTRLRADEMPAPITSLYVQAEALYFQCQVMRQKLVSSHFSPLSLSLSGLSSRLNASQTVEKSWQ